MRFDVAARGSVFQLLRRWGRAGRKAETKETLSRAAAMVAKDAGVMMQAPDTGRNNCRP